MTQDKRNNLSQGCIKKFGGLQMHMKVNKLLLKPSSASHDGRDMKGGFDV